MTRGDRRMLVALAALSSVVMLLQAAGALSPDLLYFAPLLVLGMPLLAGRYVGEAAIERIAARRRPLRQRRAARPSALPVRAAVRLLPRGGRLIAFSLAVRPPPALTSS